MEIVWAALSIAIIVGFVLYVLARRWQEALARQSWTIRQLSQRVRELETMDDPTLRRKLEESAPVPLEQVLYFSFRLSDRFWRDALGLTTVEREFVRARASFVGLVKLERWRSHTVAAITEAVPAPLPQNGGSGAGWQTRTLELYPKRDGRAGALILWEVPLQEPNGAEPDSLRLSLHPDCLELTRSAAAQHEVHASEADAAAHSCLLRVPFARAELAALRIDGDAVDGITGESFDGSDRDNPPGSQEIYGECEEELGIEWELRVRDLARNNEWERWKILETRSPTGGAGRA